MAVYTHLAQADVERLLAEYNVGTLNHYEGIIEGVENSNYKICAGHENYILTVFEKRTPEADLPFFFAFMAHLSNHGIACPHAIPARSGESVVRIANKPAALISFLSGSNVPPDEITPELCRQTGYLLARMHLAAADFPLSRENGMSLAAWENIDAKIHVRLDEIEPGLAALVESELSTAKDTMRADLPRGVVHADIFPDNVFQYDGQISGVIDFYFSATDAFVYDLAIAINAWCFTDGRCDDGKRDAFLAGYQSLRILNDHEKTALPNFSRAAALRILTTRAHDWLFQQPDALVKAKDPRDYIRILKYHRDDKRG